MSLSFSFCDCRGLVLEVIFHPKDMMIITAGDDAEIRVWDLITKSCVATLKVDYCDASHSLQIALQCSKGCHADQF
jgi:WD40 repeat protein